jgi:hypothetical protein
MRTTLDSESFGFAKWRGSARLESLLVATLFDSAWRSLSK